MALEWLEQGRCLVWSQLNQLRTSVDMLRIYDASLADSFLAALRALESLGSRSSPEASTSIIAQQIQSEDKVHRHAKLAQEWTQLLDKIHGIPEFQDFLRPPRAIDILSQLPPDGPVIVINVHNSRCDALVLIHGKDDALHIPLEDFTYEKAENARNDLCEYLEFNGYRMRSNHTIKTTVPHPAVLEHILRELWTDVVRPILKVLGYSVSY